MSLDNLTPQERHELGLPQIGFWAALRFRAAEFIQNKPQIAYRLDRLAIQQGDPQALQKSKRRAKFLLDLMDELTDRKLPPEKAIDVAMIWLKTPAALEDLEQWGGKREG